MGQTPGSHYRQGSLLTKSWFYFAKDLCSLDHTELPFPLQASLHTRNTSPKQLMASSPIDVRDDLDE